jgi:hypothetical protein
MTIPSDHPLLISTRAATTDPDAERRMIARIETVETTVAEALAADPAEAAVRLPAALVLLYIEYQQSIAESLVSGFTEIDAHHAALYRRAQQLFGTGQRVVQAPAHEPLTPGRASPFWSLWR